MLRDTDILFLGRSDIIIIKHGSAIKTGALHCAWKYALKIVWKKYGKYWADVNIKDWRIFSCLLRLSEQLIWIPLSRVCQSVSPSVNHTWVVITLYYHNYGMQIIQWSLYTLVTNNISSILIDCMPGGVTSIIKVYTVRLRREWDILFRPSDICMGIIFKSKSMGYLVNSNSI